MSENTKFQDTHPIDFSSALERIGGDEDFLQELLDIYVEDFLEKHAQLLEAIRRQDFQAIKEIGHSLKGASGNLSLNGLQEASYQVEMAGRENNLDGAKTHFRRLHEEFNRMLACLPPHKQAAVEQRWKSQPKDVF